MRRFLAVAALAAFSGCATVESFGYKTADGSLFVYTKNTFPPGSSTDRHVKGMQLDFKDDKQTLTVRTNQDETGLKIKEMPLGEALRVLSGLSKLVIP
jgi:hypothetical protein